MHAPEQFRVTTGLFASSAGDGPNGVFNVRYRSSYLTVIASKSLGWEHVSVSLPHRTPTWEEMCFIKDLFWNEEDCVVQYHPPKSDYVDIHKYCLHLWRSEETEFPRPPYWMVGPLKGKTADTRYLDLD